MKFPSLLLSILAGLVLFASAVTVYPADPPDDAALFVEAFTAYQKKDYLLAIDKIGQLNQQYPDTPLRDVALLLLARSGWKAGDNELAAKTINQFNADFSGNPLKSSIEEELGSLGTRQQKGERLAPNKTLQASARKVRNDILAQERAESDRLERERQAKIRAEQERVAREKAEAERKERERLAAERAARESIKAAVSFGDSATTIEAGESGRIPFEIVNRGKNREEFLLEASAPTENGIVIAAAEQADTPLSRIALAPGETFRGLMTVRMPADRVDGHRGTITVKAVSAKYSDVIHSRETLLIASAPLVRVVAKPQVKKAAPGEQVRYRVTVLNIGSVAAQGLTARIQAPQQMDFAESPTAGYRLEGGAVVYRIDRIEPGKLEEIQVDFKLRSDSRKGAELKPQIEVVNGKLQRKDTFGASSLTIQ